MRPAEGSEVRRRRGWRRGPMDQEGTAESRRGTRTRVVREDEDQRSSGGRRGPWSRGMGADAAGCNVATVTCG